MYIDENETKVFSNNEINYYVGNLIRSICDAVSLFLFEKPFLCLHLLSNDG